jgi:hypothetical protein
VMRTITGLRREHQAEVVKLDGAIAAGLKEPECGG